MNQGPAKEPSYLLRIIDARLNDQTVKFRILGSPYTGHVGKIIRVPIVDFNWFARPVDIVPEKETQYYPERFVSYLKRTNAEKDRRLRESQRLRLERIAEQVLGNPRAEDDSVDID